MRRSRWGRLSWEAAQSWGATDYLNVLPDSLTFQGFTALHPEVFRVSVALHLCTPYWRLAGREELPVCTGRACEVLLGEGGELHHTPACRAGDHGLGSHVTRHNAWGAVWEQFLRAHGFRMQHGPQLEAGWPRCLLYTSPSPRDS